MGKERTYRSLRTEDQAAKLAQLEGWTEMDIQKQSCGSGWLGHFKNTGETLKQVRIDLERALKITRKSSPNNYK